MTDHDSPTVRLIYREIIDTALSYLDRAEKAERVLAIQTEFQAGHPGMCCGKCAASIARAEARVAELENILRGQLPHDPHYDGPSDIKARAALSSDGSAAAEVIAQSETECGRPGASMRLPELCAAVARLRAERVIQERGGK